MADEEYKLSTELISHGLDVRCVAIAKEDCILSASRDKTAKLWHPEGIKEFANVVTYQGHRNFVSTVCWMEPCERFPEGLVITGSNDTTINGYNLQNAQIQITLKGHENAVAYVSGSKEPGILFSASWDNTARIWNVNNENGSPVILKRHQAAVWAVVQLANGTIATASADKTIALWTRSGEWIRDLTGHKDCVRGLTVASAETFLSCSNDASIKLWTNTGECLNTYLGHTNYIYSVCMTGNIIVSGGEDSTVRLWRSTEEICHITVPAQSVWSVAGLSNGDIVAGCSDGAVRVFSKHPSRWADEATRTRFENEVLKAQDASKQEIGGFKLSELPGPEVLFEPGQTDGQTKLVRRGTNVKAYSWSAATQSWSEIGDVMGSNPAAEGKTMYRGKEYDFVFSVDIKDGEPPIKLPYNRGEDPWVAAQAFIHKNELPQVYLDQIANFIITNAKIDQLPVTSNGGDPFTGSSRYVPGSAPAAAPVGPAPDPFTGSGAYTTSVANQTIDKPLVRIDSYLRFDQANLSQIFEKLKEFNQRNGDGASSFTDSQLEAVVKLGEPNATCSPEVLSLLKRLLEWPREILFPVLDITRLAVRIKEVNEELFGSNKGPDFIKFLISLLSDSSAANQMLSLRVLVNSFAHLSGEMLVLTENIAILCPLVKIDMPNKNLQIAVATLLLNLTVALAQQQEAEDLAESLIVLLNKFTEDEAMFRGLVALEKLLVESPKKVLLKTKIVSDHNLYRKLKERADSLPSANATAQKVSNWSRQIVKLL